MKVEEDYCLTISSRERKDGLPYGFVAVGTGIMFFGLLMHGWEGLLLVGFIPVLVGTVLLVHAFGISPGAGNQGKADSGLNHE